MKGQVCSRVKPGNQLRHIDVKCQFWNQTKIGRNSATVL